MGWEGKQFTVRLLHTQRVYVWHPLDAAGGVQLLHVCTLRPFSVARAPVTVVTGAAYNHMSCHSIVIVHAHDTNKLLVTDTVRTLRVPILRSNDTRGRGADRCPRRVRPLKRQIEHLQAQPETRVANQPRPHRQHAHHVKRAQQARDCSAQLGGGGTKGEREGGGIEDYMSVMPNTLMGEGYFMVRG